MEETMRKLRKEYDKLDLDQLLHPAQAFLHPSEVVDDPDLTLNEKRSILASWASDACAVEAAPALREVPGGNRVNVDDILEALRELDKQQAPAVDRKYRRVIRRRRIFSRGDDGDQGRSLQ
jgi:hypothetical protein